MIPFISSKKKKNNRAVDTSKVFFLHFQDAERKNHSLYIPDSTHLVRSMNSLCGLFISPDSQQRRGKGSKRVAL